MAEVKTFLTRLAMVETVSTSTQNQTFNALLFLFREVLARPLEGLTDTVRHCHRSVELGHLWSKLTGPP